MCRGRRRRRAARQWRRGGAGLADAGGPRGATGGAGGDADEDLRAVIVHLELEGGDLLGNVRILRVRRSDRLAELLRQAAQVRTGQAVRRRDLRALPRQPDVL